MTSTKSTFLALVAVLLSPMAANADPITVDFELASTDPAFGSFTFDSSLDGAILSYANLDDFSFTVFGVEYDLAFLQSGSFGVFYSFAFDTNTDSFVSQSISGFGVVLSAIKADFSQGFFVGCCESGPAYAEYSDFRTGRYEQIQVTRQVPEPSTLALLGLGLLGMGLARRKKV